VGPDPLSSNIFSTDFIQSVASSLDEYDPGIFRPDGDINFERDFGQWFNQDGMGGGQQQHNPGPRQAQGQISPSPSLLLPDPLSSNIFSTDFIQSVARSLDDFDPGIFRPDGDIDFERDFGQWFNQDAMGGGSLDSMK
jgi:hypothetical protein